MPCWAALGGCQGPGPGAWGAPNGVSGTKKPHCCSPRVQSMCILELRELSLPARKTRGCTGYGAAGGLGGPHLGRCCAPAVSPGLGTGWAGLQDARGSQPREGQAAALELGPGAPAADGRPLSGCPSAWNALSGVLFSSSCLCESKGRRNTAHGGPFAPVSPPPRRWSGQWAGSEAQQACGGWACPVHKAARVSSSQPGRGVRRGGESCAGAEQVARLASRPPRSDGPGPWGAEDSDILPSETP